MDDLKAGITRGIDFLIRHNPEKIEFHFYGGCNHIEPQNPEFSALLQAIDIGYIGLFSAGRTIEMLFKAAEKGLLLNYSVSVEKSRRFSDPEKPTPTQWTLSRLEL